MVLGMSNIQLGVGDAAPDFELPNDEGGITKLSDYSRVLVYFYPKANTPGCTKEACDFRDSLGQLNDLGIDVVGISRTSRKNSLSLRKITT